FGILGAITGYELARGSFLGLPVNSLLILLDNTIGIGGFTNWNVSISASMVLMCFFFFLLAWILSPRYGVISGILRRNQQRLDFEEQLLMGHLYTHMNAPDMQKENAADSLHEHLAWDQNIIRQTLNRLLNRGWVQVKDGLALPTESGIREVEAFRVENLE